MVDNLRVELNELLNYEVVDLFPFGASNGVLHRVEHIYERFHALVGAECSQSQLGSLLEVLLRCGNRFFVHLKKAGQGSSLELLKTCIIILRMVRNVLAICKAEVKTDNFSCFNAELKHILEDYSIKSKDVNRNLDETLALVRCCLQIVANMSFSGINNIHEYFKTFYDILLCIICNESEDKKVRSYAMAAFYGIVMNCDNVMMELNQKCSGWSVLTLTQRLISEIINSEDNTSGTEWSLFVFKLMLKSYDYLKVVWGSLSAQERIFIVEVLSLEMDKLNDQRVEGVDDITNICHESNIDFLCLELSNHLASFVMGQDKVAQPKDDSNILSFISHSSTYFHLLAGLKHKEVLLTRAIDLLKILHGVDVQKNNTDADEKILSEAKLNLMRMVANLVHRNKVLQDMLRNDGGLNMILNMTTIDPNCPTIQQWALFAINNLCEGNEENQNYISNLKLERLADVSRDLNASGIKVEVRDGKLHFLKREK